MEIQTHVHLSPYFVAIVFVWIGSFSTNLLNLNQLNGHLEQSCALSNWLLFQDAYSEPINTMSFWCRQKSIQVPTDPQNNLERKTSSEPFRRNGFVWRSELIENREFQPSMGFLRHISNHTQTLYPQIATHNGRDGIYLKMMEYGRIDAHFMFHYGFDE